MTSQAADQDGHVGPSHCRHRVDAERDASRRRHDVMDVPGTRRHSATLDVQHSSPPTPSTGNPHKAYICLSVSHITGDNTPQNGCSQGHDPQDRDHSPCKQTVAIKDPKLSRPHGYQKVGGPEMSDDTSIGRVHHYSIDSLVDKNRNASNSVCNYLSIEKAWTHGSSRQNGANMYQKQTNSRYTTKSRPKQRKDLFRWAGMHCTCIRDLSKYVFVIFFFGILMPGLRCQALVPPTFNAAKLSPISVTPSTAVCGLSGKEAFCRSSIDPATVSACWEDDCDATCPNKALPHHEFLFNRVTDGWGDCVSKQFDKLAPAPPTAQVQLFRVNFKAAGGTGSTCFLNLATEWMAALFLQSVRSITLATWIRPVPTDRESTLFVIVTEAGTDVLRLGLLSNLQLFIMSHNTVKTSRGLWVLPANQWTHLAVRVLDKTVSVSLNGSYVSPTAYNVDLGPPRSASKYIVGQSFSTDDHFVGDMQDFRIYIASLSNREIQEVYLGVIPETRTQSSCRCPPTRPLIRDEDPTYCVANDGLNRPTTIEFRLNRLSHPIEFANDGKDDTAWISQPTGEQEDVTVTVQLGNVLEVLRVEFRFYSPFPNTLKVERRKSPSSDWTPWQLYAHDCQSIFSLPANGELVAEDSVNCRSMVPKEGTPPYSNGEIVLDLLAGRPGTSTNTTSYSLRQFLQADAVRLTMRGHPFVQNENHMYHALAEVTVDARCDCHGHARSCDTSVTPYVCACANETYTRGRQCDECVMGTYKDTTKDEYAIDVCRPCDCEPAGTVDGDHNCETFGGQCKCKPKVGWRRCDTCRPGYFGLRASDKDGCRPCTCYINGTKNGNNVCDVITAQCACKDHVTGMECDVCKKGYYKLESTNPLGCSSCACDPTGSMGSSCDQNNGQCQCKTTVTGQACGQCIDGFYNLTKSNPRGCSPCECDPLGSETRTCNQLTGQCTCRTNVIGRRCDKCKPGYYANNESDMSKNGCVHLCDCVESGSDPKAGGDCRDLGGQCPCKINTSGRRCDQCKDATYGFGRSTVGGCLPCACYVMGTVNGSESCDVTSGQCRCKSAVQGRRCGQCAKGMFGMESRLEAGCRSCGCYPPGTIGGASCDANTGRCHCIPGAGDPAVTNYKCSPYGRSVVPTFGPESGGTVLEIRGGFLGNISNANMKVGQVPCSIVPTENNHTTLTCITGSLPLHAATSVKGTPLPVTLHVNNVTDVTMPDEFTYLSDPKISHVEPLETFLMGGLILTVSGSHLTSVHRPVMEVTMAAPDFSKVFPSVCSVQMPGMMHCPTPNIQLPKDVPKERIRKRRDVDSTTENDDEAQFPLTSLTREEHRSRVKRASHAKPLNRDTLQFFLGFLLDGVTRYRNLSNVMPQYSVLRVYLDPSIDRFEEDGHISTYKPYWPYQNKLITIKGSRMDYGCGVDDYRVTIGQSECKDLDLATNQLVCRPPARQPDADPTHGPVDGIPHVTVYVGNIKQHVGWVDYEHNFWENMPFRYGIMGGLAAVVLLIIIIIVCCCRRSKQKNAEKHPHLEMSAKTGNNAYISAYNGSQTSYVNPTMEVLTLLPPALRTTVQECLIDYKRIEIGKLIGQGHFARVYLGRLTDDLYSEHIPVAIKTLREYHVTPRDVGVFLEEATIMKGFKHIHVLHLLGVVIENNRVYVLLPYMENGDMKTFISNEDNLLTVGELINFGLQVSDGMCYLAAQKFVHRDLAARNCMVDKNLVVRIADFGLSRDIYESDYYKEGDLSRSLPVKWMAPESLERGLYTTKCDVWSFGVLLWELMTRGCTPYPDVDSFDMKTYIMCGNRMDKPDFAPNELFLLMWHCWKADPAARPNFTEINSQLAEILEGQNATTAMRKHHQKQVIPRSYGRNGFLLDMGRM